MFLYIPGLTYGTKSQLNGNENGMKTVYKYQTGNNGNLEKASRDKIILTCVFQQGEIIMYHLGI